MATLATALLPKKAEPDDEQLLKLFWNRAELKQELGRLRREKEKLGEQVRQQETANLRLQQRLEALENLLTDPQQAANAVVYYQLRGVWQLCRRRLVRLARDLAERQKARENQQAVAAFEQRRDAALAAIDETLVPSQERARRIEGDLRQTQERLRELSGFWNYFRRGPLRDQVETIRASLEGLQAQIARQVAQRREKEAEAPPTLESVSVQGRRNINVALIALAQELLLTLSEQQVAQFARDAAVRSLVDVHYGDATACQALGRTIEAAITRLGDPEHAVASTRRRAEYLRRAVEYRRDADAVPLATSVATVPIVLNQDGPARPAVDRSLPVNVLAEDYWDLCSVLLS